MNGVAQIAALIGALAYIGAAPAEMFFFHKPAARKFLHVEADNIADVQMWAFVVGFRNLLAGIRHDRRADHPANGRRRPSAERSS